MRRMLAGVVLCGLAALAACGRDEVSLENATANEVAEAVKHSELSEMKPKPGKWEYSMTMVELDAPGMPPEIASQMKERMSATRVTEKCLTAADVEKFDSYVGEMPQGCTFEHYKASAGKLDAKLNCQHQGMTQQMTMTGTFNETSSDMAMTTKASGASPMGAMTMKMAMKGKRVGPCEAEGAAAAN